MKIYIVRHGESEWNILKRTQGSKNTKLTRRGREQAKLLSKRLLDANISHIYTSDLDRAYETANIISEALGLKVKATKDLRELSLGKWEGLSRNQIEDQFPKQLDSWHKDINFKSHYGESITEARIRVNWFLDSIFNCHKRNNIVLVSHAIICKLLITELLKIPTQHLWSFKIDNASISIVERRDLFTSSLTINDTCHLKRQLI